MIVSSGVQNAADLYGIADAQKEIKVLKDATLNNMVNNVFLINFDTVTSVAITSGIYDSVARKIYV